MAPEIRSVGNQLGLGGGSVDRHLARARNRASLRGVEYEVLVERLRELGAEPMRSRSGVRCLTICHNEPHQGDRNLWFGPTESGSWSAVCHSHRCTYRTIVNKVYSLGPLKSIDGSEIAPSSMIKESASERMAKRPPLFDDDQLAEIGEERVNLFAHSFSDPEKYGYDTLVDYISEDRCISKEMMEVAWLGWRPHELRLTVPYITPSALAVVSERRGRQVYGRDRWQPHMWRERDRNGRLRWPKLLTEDGWARWLYHPPAVDEEAPLPEDGYAWLVEGAVDALAGASCGLPMIAYPAAGNWWPAWSRELVQLGVRHLQIIPDNDDVGRKSARLVRRRLRIEAPDMEVVIRKLDVPEGGDLIDWFRQ